MTARPPITCHVLDTAKGKPAQNVEISLYKKTSDFELIGTSSTNSDGRVPSWNIDSSAPVLQATNGSWTLETGIYRLDFNIDNYYGSQPHFFPSVSIHFEVTDPSQHYHVPLLLSPFSYSTYRGS
ncbi:hypothetical protein CANCADRAFT_21694 [Tortispora caseinolytica NRRL Y-17796]|uniref:5-hydroxyisourate hydrolase n=1 Tax=Tortispora caseinolytica NRRL Y-17796 TaxID=767744 RepID=A0A1E4TJ85_9ASCO|nr:hypothetical protein CANCADRAFT_21694 [Tortispora caseinolytica NRRL Y-17796]